MNTPICDFVREYAASDAIRAHVPGHKGRSAFAAVKKKDAGEPDAANAYKNEGEPDTANAYKNAGAPGATDIYEETLSSIYPFDITEIAGADELYHAQSIIAESEANASELFGCPTYYSTEGSSLCIRAMIYLCMMKQTEDAFPAREALASAVSASSDDSVSSDNAVSSDDAAAPDSPASSAGRPSRPRWILATRNAHKTFMSACILLGLESEWIRPTGKAGSMELTDVTEALMAGITKYGSLPCCVYVTSPDYTGEELPLKRIVEAAHRRGVPVAVDNAHGAYLHFLMDGFDPIKDGADICCDSAHKTLPVLTGGAYLHISEGFVIGNRETEAKRIREAMALFASTSPSWLILQSLDLANKVLSEGWAEALDNTCAEVFRAKRKLEAGGIEMLGDELLKIVIRTRPLGYQGYEFAELLRDGLVPDSDHEGDSSTRPIEVEFADPDMVVLMISPSNTKDEIRALVERILKIPRREPLQGEKYSFVTVRGVTEFPERVMTMREASMMPCEYVPVDEALGRVAHLMDVACPPAVPIVMPGERIGEKQIEIMKYYGYTECKVVRE